MPDLSPISQTLSTLINTAETMITHTGRQHFWQTANLMRAFSSQLHTFFDIAAPVLDKNTITSILTDIKKLNDAQSRKNYILLADILELMLLPSFYEIQAMLLQEISIPQKNFFAQNMALAQKNSAVISSHLYQALKKWQDSMQNNKNAAFFAENYVLEPSGSGFLTLNKQQNGQFYYLHSNQNPWTKGRIFAEEYTDKTHFDYVLAGFGLGYEAISILAKDARYHLTILETDINIIGAAFSYMDLSYLFQCGRTELVYSPDLHELNQYLSDMDTRFLIHYPSLISMADGKPKELLQEFFLHAASVQEQCQLLDENFYYNQKNGDRTIDDLKNEFQDKTVVYIGGGPSAEQKLPDIRQYLETHPGTVTICAGKVYRKLLEAGFCPDFVIISDAKLSLSWQLANIPENKCRLLYLATASRSAVQAFHGKRYTLYQNAYEPSEAFAHKNNLTLFETGGSVSALAIDLALRLGCKTLITTGLDLSYPKQHSHAFGIAQDVQPDTSCMTTDIYGNKVQTCPTFLTYQKWIEQRVAKVSGITLLNVTDGVKIKGMENVAHL